MMSENPPEGIPSIQDIEAMERLAYERDDPRILLRFLKDADKAVRIYLETRRTPEIAALLGYLPEKIAETELWQAQWIVRRQHGVLGLRGRAFALPPGEHDKELEQHLFEIRSYNKIIWSQAAGHAYYHLPECKKTGRDQEEAIAQSEANVQEYQQIILSHIKDWADAIQATEARRGYLEKMALWYEEADQATRLAYPADIVILEPFSWVAEQIRRLPNETQGGDGRKEGHTTEGSESPDFERLILTQTVLRQKEKIKALIRWNGRPSREDMRQLIDKHRFKSSRKANCAKIGKELGKNPTTVKNWIAGLGLSDYAFKNPE